jgi:ABC-type xylose transport system, periplasmic component
MRNSGYCKIFNAALLVICILFQTGCSQGLPNKEKGQNGRVLIGFSMDTLKEERWTTDRDLFVQEVQKLGGNVDVKISNDNGDNQSAQVKALIDEGIKVLVIIPHDANTSAAAVQMAKKAGVKVISYDRLVRNANVDLYISFDNVKVGALMGKALVASVPKGNYVVLNGPQNDNNSFMLNQGFLSVLEPYIKKGDIKIVEEDWVDDWMADAASNDIAKVLQKGQQVSAVFGGDDALAGGVIETLSEQRLTGKVMVVGQDADLSACQMVVEGQQLMTVYKPIDQLARQAAFFAYSMATGKNTTFSATISDGTYTVPYYALTPIAVTKKNMVSTVIKDKFHSLSDVYRNVPVSEWPVSVP